MQQGEQTDPEVQDCFAALTLDPYTVEGKKNCNSEHTTKEIADPPSTANQDNASRFIANSAIVYRTVGVELLLKYCKCTKGLQIKS